MSHKERKPIDPAALATARAGLSQVTGKRRLDLILDAPDPQALVRALPADELYLTVRELGLGDAASLVQLASAEQFRTFLDLDAWKGGALVPGRALPWLRAARAGSNQSPQAARRWAAKLRLLDRELLHLVLRGALRVHDLEAEPDPVLTSSRFMRTAEGKYVLEFLVEGTEYLAVRGIVDDLIADDPFTATRLFSALAWDLPSELEETERRWRDGRLADLGYPSPEEALSWFARPPREPAAPAGSPARPPGFWLATFRRGALLDRAADRLGPQARDAFEVELVAAANAVLVADAVDPGDPDAVRAAVEAARAKLELGLEALSGGDEARAAAVLEETPLKRVFQHGFLRTLELRWRAERLFQAGGAGTPALPLLDAPLGEAMAALTRRRPAFFPGLDLPREEWGDLAARAFVPRHFLSAEELARTAAALDLCEGLAAIARELALAPPERSDREPPRLSALYLTALANERLGRAFAPTPLAAAELPRAAALLATVEDPRLADRGEAGQLLLDLARHRAEELAPLREGGEVPAAHQAAVLVG
ncbi:DUF6178 family protein [Anaeromyxobacter paludicola]|uniref:Uncharacterized protein n=1 Tax=Anaeromyxobacter paludicola TaxID=2918171 RepID=A0ABN6N830_9BACT|nr:DUF6178 family protein [Anaeromyxobacter paludicola]BDG08107.1 hypothetical protein AMPC_12200 [Anaeromyxobacter paludicola]